MNHMDERQSPNEPGHIYAKLNQQDVEQFYIGYQLWNTRQRIAALQTQIEPLHQQISENAQRLQQVHPPAVALATLARLQADGVTDIDLLDRMLERGEEWLDLTMQRLDYCEQLDFIHDNYTQWCEHALEGAYDWIDSMRDAYADTLSLPVVTTPTAIDEASVQATEELLLRKLTSDGDEEEMVSLETTLKRPGVSLAPSVPASEETQLGQPQGSNSPSVSDEQEYVEFASPAEAPLPVEADAQADSLLVPSEQEDEVQYVEFAPAAAVPPPIEADADSSLVTQARQAEDEQSLGEIAPYPEDAGRFLEASEAPLPIDAKAETNLFSVSDEQHTEHDHVEPITDASLSTEAEIERLPVSVEQKSEPEYVEFAPAVEAAHPVEAEAQADTSHDETDVQVSTAKNWEQPAQEVKPQQQRGFWRRLLAIIRGWH